MDLQQVPLGVPVSRAKDHIQRSASLHQVCQKFESVFIAYLLKSMRKTVPESDDTSFATRYQFSMMDEKLAHTMAEGPGIGLAKVLYKQLDRFLVSDPYSSHSMTQDAKTSKVISTSLRYNK